MATTSRTFEFGVVCRACDAVVPRTEARAFDVGEEYHDFEFECAACLADADTEGSR